MIIKKDKIERIKSIIAKHFVKLIIGTVGNKVFTATELKELEDQGINTKDKTSLLSLIYYNNYLNESSSKQMAKTIPQAITQQSKVPAEETHVAAVEHLNDNYRQLVEKLTQSAQSRFEGLIRDTNMDYRNEVLQNIDRPDYLSNLVKQSTVGGLKQKLRDFSSDSYRDWKRVAVTEIANSVGMGAMDRVVDDNQGKDFDEVYVYRITKGDSKVCKYCKAFFEDSDGSPKVYKLSTIMANGTNYGKKAVDWKPVAGNVHPGERCGGILELRPGWKVLPGGTVEFIGKEEWQSYIAQKVQS